MPKKIDEWHQVGKPTTLSQINTFFDLCTKWLVGTPLPYAQEKLTVTNSYTLDDKKFAVDFAFSEIEINENIKNECFVCKSENNINIITANPFTRKNQIFVCNNCFPQSDST